MRLKKFLFLVLSFVLGLSLWVVGANAQVTGTYDANTKTYTITSCSVQSQSEWDSALAGKDIQQIYVQTSLEVYNDLVVSHPVTVYNSIHANYASSKSRYSTITFRENVIVENGGIHRGTVTFQKNLALTPKWDGSNSMSFSDITLTVKGNFTIGATNRPVNLTVRGSSSTYTTLRVEGSVLVAGFYSSTYNGVTSQTNSAMYLQNYCTATFAGDVTIDHGYVYLYENKNVSIGGNLTVKNGGAFGATPGGTSNSKYLTTTVSGDVIISGTGRNGSTTHNALVLTKELTCTNLSVGTGSQLISGATTVNRNVNMSGGSVNAGTTVNVRGLASLQNNSGFSGTNIAINGGATLNNSSISCTTLNTPTCTLTYSGNNTRMSNCSGTWTGMSTLPVTWGSSGASSFNPTVESVTTVSFTGVSGGTGLISIKSQNFKTLNLTNVTAELKRTGTETTMILSSGYYPYPTFQGNTSFTADPNRVCTVQALNMTNSSLTDAGSVNPTSNSNYSRSVTNNVYSHTVTLSNVTLTSRSRLVLPIMTIGKLSASEGCAIGKSETWKSCSYGSYYNSADYGSGSWGEVGITEVSYSSNGPITIVNDNPSIGTEVTFGVPLVANALTLEDCNASTITINGTKPLTMTNCTVGAITCGGETELKGVAFTGATFNGKTSITNCSSSTNTVFAQNARGSVINGGNFKGTPACNGSSYVTVNKGQFTDENNSKSTYITGPESESAAAVSGTTTITTVKLSNPPVIIDWADFPQNKEATSMT